MTTRHEFLAMLHEHLQPRGYLEIGVQYGTSLALAKCPAIGIDPAPMLQGHFKDTQVFTQTSDSFFSDANLMEWWGVPVDLAFIDGMHLYEFALRDFMNIERYANPRTVVVLDDVLPRNDEEASREQCPGDWTGDVWKVPRLLKTFRGDLTTLLVDTEPTGTAAVFNLDPGNTRLDTMYEGIIGMGLENAHNVPQQVLDRDDSVSAEEALEQVLDYLRSQE